MERWILSFTQSLLTFVREEMTSEWGSGGEGRGREREREKSTILVLSFLPYLEYRMYTVVPRLVRFIDQLTNWYVRFNRKRIKVSNRVYKWLSDN
jgi:isoleucyl-tRNA synthetase